MLIPFPSDVGIIENRIQLQYAQAVQPSPFTLESAVTSYGAIRWRGQISFDAAIADVDARERKRLELDRFMARLGDRRNWSEWPTGRPVLSLAGDGAIAAQDIAGDLLQVTLMADEAGADEGQWCRIGNRTYQIDQKTSNRIFLLTPGIIGTGSALAAATSIRGIVTPGQDTSAPWSIQRRGPWIASYDEYLGS